MMQPKNYLAQHSLIEVKKLIRNLSVFYLVALGIVAYLYFAHPKHNPLAFFENQEKNESLQIPIMIKNDLPTIKDAPSVHSSSIASLNGGRMIAVWFAGSGEGKPDVKIYGSIYDPSNNLWGDPKPLLDRKQLQKDSRQFIKKLGNPVIYRSPSGDIHLFVVGVTFGGWATSKIYHYISGDNAQSFVYKGLLKLGIFMNLSHLVRSSPIGLEDGGFYLPIYHELADKYPLITRFDKDGNMLYSQKLTSLKGQLQPSMVALDSKNCLAVFRNYKIQAMHMQTCEDGGLSWNNPQKTNIINEGSSIALFKIQDKIYLLHNTREKNPQEARGTLVLSELDKNIWKQIAILDVAQGIREQHKSVEVSYPNVYVNGDVVDIVYTNNRTHISHIRLNQKWISNQKALEEK